MKPSVLRRPAIALHLLLGVLLLAILGWRVAVWNNSGWSGMSIVMDRRSQSPLFPEKARGTVYGLVQDGPAARAGIARFDVVESVDGPSAGGRVQYRVKNKGTRTITLESPLRSAIIVSDLVVSTLLTLFYIAVGGLVLSKKPDSRQAFIFDVMAVVGAMSFFITGLMRVDAGTPTGVATAARGIIGAVGNGFKFFLFALLLHFALIFPRLRPPALQPRSWKRMLLLIYLPPSVVTTAQIVQFFVAERSSAFQTPVTIVLMICFGLMITFPFVTCIALARSYKESGVEEKRQIRWPVWGTVVAIGAPLFLSIAIGVLRVSYHLEGGPWVDTLNQLAPKVAFLLIPIAFAIGIMKYRLMQIDRLMQKTTVYAVLTLILVAFYLILAGGLGAIVVRTTNLRNEWVIIVSTLAVASVLFPIRARVQSLVERRIFPKRFSYPEALAFLAEACRRAEETKQVAQASAESIQLATSCRFVVVLSRDAAGAELRSLAKIGLPDEKAAMIRLDPNRFRSLKDPAPASGDFEIPGAALIVPIRRETRLAGLIVIGRRLDGEEYEPEDLQFLATAAEEVSLAMSRIEMHRGAGEFDDARAIQSRLVPSTFPRIDGFEISGAWEPARVVGGDYFDVLPLDSPAIALCIGDVVGKGIAAALLMSNLQATVRAFASPSPADLCKRLHTLVRNNVSMGRFVTFFYGVLDTERRSFRYCNAGHNPPILVRLDGTREELSTGGPALGAFAAAKYEESSVTMRRGDRLVLFTDGVTEAAEDEEQFGEQRLVEFIRENRALDATSLQQRLVQTVKRFSGDVLQDDVTLLVLAAV